MRRRTTLFWGRGRRHQREEQKAAIDSAEVTRLRRGDEQLSFGVGGEVTNDGGSRPKKGEGPQKRGPEGLN